MLPIALVIVAVFALLPASAAADGLPAVGVDANPVSIPGGKVEYQTEKAGKATRVVESARYGGELQARRIPGVYSIPAVAYDGSPSGLAADGRTLVLINPRVRFPRARPPSPWSTRERSGSAGRSCSAATSRSTRSRRTAA